MNNLKLADKSESTHPDLITVTYDVPASNSDLVFTIPNAKGDGSPYWMHIQMWDGGGGGSSDTHGGAGGAGGAWCSFDLLVFVGMKLNIRSGFGGAGGASGTHPSFQGESGKDGTASYISAKYPYYNSFRVYIAAHDTFPKQGGGRGVGSYDGGLGPEVFKSMDDKLKVVTLSCIKNFKSIKGGNGGKGGTVYSISTATNGESIASNYNGYGNSGGTGGLVGVNNTGTGSSVERGGGGGASATANGGNGGQAEGGEPYRFGGGGGGGAGYFAGSNGEDAGPNAVERRINAGGKGGDGRVIITFQCINGLQGNAPA